MAFSSEDQEKLVHAIRLSSVSSERVTGEGVVYEPTDIDLATKLHYIRAVYFFRAESVQGVTVHAFKEACFLWLNYYYEVCGRFRRSGSDSTNGRPYVKCNDCGVRFVEAKSDQTLDQWFDMVKVDHPSSEAQPHRILVPNQVIGPELIYSPLLSLQLTFLKCGGISLGLSWSHVLGDAFSATEFINAWSRILSGNQPTHSPSLDKTSISKSINHEESTSPKSILSPCPLSVKTTADPVGDLWVVPTTSKMETLSFLLTPAKLAQIQTKLGSNQSINDQSQITSFEAICAVLWKSIARARDIGLEPKTLTIIRQPDAKGKEFRGRIGKDLLGNAQVVSILEAPVDIQAVGDADPIYLARLVRDRAVDERSRISKMVEKEAGVVDLVLYGANLTFVDLQTADWYGFKLNGHKPSFVNCFVDGVGQEGLVLVLPANQDEAAGRLVNVTLPDGQTKKLKRELAHQWCIGV